MTFEVRCCCRPDNLLGWIDLPVAGPRPYVWVALRDGSREELEIARYSDRPPDGRTSWQWAVKSNEIPIERWRLMPGFQENR